MKIVVMPQLECRSAKTERANEGGSERKDGKPLPIRQGDVCAFCVISSARMWDFMFLLKLAVGRGLANLAQARMTAIDACGFPRGRFWTIARDPP